eukprot:4402644-Pyramimonas_sp.AAC.2
MVRVPTRRDFSRQNPWMPDRFTVQSTPSDAEQESDPAALVRDTWNALAGAWARADPQGAEDPVSSISGGSGGSSLPVSAFRGSDQARAGGAEGAAELREDALEEKAGASWPQVSGSPSHPYTTHTVLRARHGRCKTDC